jgi:hypothetical protein
MRVVVFVMLGAIVNIAVAWGLAMLVNEPRHGGFGLSRCTGGDPAINPEWGTLRVNQVWCAGAMNIEMHRYRGGSLLPRGEGEPASLLPEWTGLREPSAAYKAGALEQWTKPGTVGAEVALVEMRGWPILSMALLHMLDLPASGMNTRHGWNTSAMRSRSQLNGHPIPRSLPLRPIWPGFALNTVFYSFVLWLMFAAPLALRRWRRIQRGLCVKCGYDLRKRPSDSLVCPECGSVSVDMADRQ